MDARAWMRCWALCAVAVAGLASATSSWDGGRGAWLDLGDEFMVNTHTKQSQFDADVDVVAETGEFVSVWTSWKQDGSGSGVYAQRFNATGGKLGGEILVPTETQSNQYDSHVAVDKAGNFVVVWSSEGRKSTSRHGVFGQRFTSSGTKEGGEFRVHAESHGHQNEADVAMNDDGAFVVVWTTFGDDSGKANVYGQCYKADGSAKGSVFMINQYTKRSQHMPAVAIAADGAFVVVWASDRQESKSYDVYGRRYTGKCKAVGNEFRVSDDEADHQYRPAVAMTSDGAFVVAYTSLENKKKNIWAIYARVYSGDGKAKDSARKVNTYSLSCPHEPSVTTDDRGNFTVLYTSTKDGTWNYNVYGQRFHYDGKPVDGEFRVNAVNKYAQFEPTVAASRRGDMVAVWTSFAQDGSCLGVFGRQLLRRTNCSDAPCLNNGKCTDDSKRGVYTCKCTSGYTGTHCETKVDSCQSSPCANGATCVSGKKETQPFVCNCAAGFTGARCETDIDECASNPCENGATCVDLADGFRCDCAEGYTAVLCNTTVDMCASQPCQNNGTCRSNTTGGYACECPAGTTGQDCEVNIDECASQPCHHGGTCVDGLNAFTCVCSRGHTGVLCETDINECLSNPCESGGTCLDAVGGFVCVCPPGLFGFRCEAEHDECSSNPCLNGATCVDQRSGWMCVCPPGWTGTTCEEDIDECASQPCQFGGTCREVGIGAFSCTCPSGRTGEVCEEDVDECASQPCQNGGTCFQGQNIFACVCPHGWAGPRCTIDVNECASSPCLNQGTCVDGLNNYTCLCMEGTSGAHCETDLDECASQPCIRGECVDLLGGFRCQCEAGITGTLCDEDLDECASEPCQNGATCLNGEGLFACVCTQGFEGTLCEDDVDECAQSSPCRHGGTCVNTEGSFHCICQAGLTGQLCETDIDECASQPCQNGGTCHHGQDIWACVCPTNFTGPRCENGGTMSSSSASTSTMQGVSDFLLGKTSRAGPFVFALILLVVLVLVVIAAILYRRKNPPPRATPVPASLRRTMSTASWSSNRVFLLQRLAS